MTDEQDILRNLPRARPGRRSERRTAGTARKPGGRAAGSGSARSGAGAGTRKASHPRAGDTAGAHRRASARAASPEPPSARPEDDSVLTGVARAAIATGEAGFRLASRLAGEAVRRLPKP